jgi:hypothetical protein
MASLYKRSNSPFWWVKYRDPNTGEIFRESTGFRIGLGSERRKALQRRDTLAANETKFVSSNKQERFELWVPAFLDIHYQDLSLIRVKGTWEKFREFLRGCKISHAAQFRREHALAYLQWRITTTDTFRGVSINTAHTELAYISKIFSEAVARGHITSNPCSKLQIRRKTPRPKAEITDREIANIRSEIQNLKHNTKAQIAFLKLRKIQWNVKEFLRVSFEIGLHQGCRLSETHLDVFRQVNLESGEISFHAKGDKFYTTALNPGLIPLIQEIRASGRTMSYDYPAQFTHLQWKPMASFYWKKFLTALDSTTFPSTAPASPASRDWSAEAVLSGSLCKWLTMRQQRFIAFIRGWERLNCGLFGRTFLRVSRTHPKRRVLLQPLQHVPNRSASSITEHKTLVNHRMEIRTVHFEKIRQFLNAARLVLRINYLTFHLQTTSSAMKADASKFNRCSIVSTTAASFRPNVRKRLTR